MHEEITETTEIYNGRIVHLVVHDVTLPDGSSAKREVINHMGAVAMVAVDDAQNVLLVRQYRLPAKEALLEVPAGTLEPGEDPLVAAARELQEEIGYRPGKLEPLGGVYPAPGYTSEYIRLYLATELTPDRLAGDADEFIEVVQMPLTEALQQVDDNTIRDAKSVAALLRAARKLGVS